MRRHGVAIDQKAGAEARPRRLQQSGQRVVIGAPAIGHTALGFRKAQPATIDRLAVGNDFRDRPQPGAHPHARRVDPGGQPVLEHRGVELPRLPVCVAPDAREGGGEQRRAVLGHMREDLVDVAILAGAKCGRIQPRAGHKILIVIAAGMGGGEDQRRRWPLRLPYDVAAGTVFNSDGGVRYRDLPPGRPCAHATIGQADRVTGGPSTCLTLWMGVVGATGIEPVTPTMSR